MNESEFRDWVRRGQGSLEGRIKAIEVKLGALDFAAPRLKELGVGEDMLDLASRLSASLNGGEVTALGICFITADGSAHTGWRSHGYERFALAGAAQELALEILKPEKADDALLAQGQMGPPVRAPGPESPA